MTDVEQPQPPQTEARKESPKQAAEQAAPAAGQIESKVPPPESQAQVPAEKEQEKEKEKGEEETVKIMTLEEARKKFPADLEVRTKQGAHYTVAHIVEVIEGDDKTG